MFKLLNLQYSFPPPELTIKATGYQWYWSHEYPDQGGFSFDSVMLQDDERAALVKTGMPAAQVPRLLASTTRWWCRSARSRTSW